MTETPTGQGKVSIVIPCYNHRAMRREELASVEQVRNPNVVEVIIVDDGSSAETIRILDEVAEAGHCVVPQPNRGPSARSERRHPIGQRRIHFAIGQRQSSSRCLLK
jgi:glycosyltransferase involved in cell wall biosynthesis